MNSQDFIAALTPVVDTLDRLGVPYYVGGSVASSVHGMPRSTNDIDLVADLQQQHVKALVSALEDAYYIDEYAVRDAIERRASFNVIYLASMFKVDIFAFQQSPFAKSEMARAQEDTLGEDEGARKFAVASAEDTVLRKLEWYRMSDHVLQRQWQDVQHILRLRGGDLDLSYLRRWAPSLGIADLLNDALKEAGLVG